MASERIDEYCGHGEYRDECCLCEVDRLIAERDQLQNELAGYKKSDALYRAGMESQSELMHDLKQRERALRAELGRAVALLREDPTMHCATGCDSCHGWDDRCRAFLADVDAMEPGNTSG